MIQARSEQMEPPRNSGAPVRKAKGSGQGKGTGNGQKGGKGQNTPTKPMAVKIKFFPPTIEEAVVAARDLSDEPEHQVEIAAGFMGIDPDDQVRAAVAEAEKQAEAERQAAAEAKASEHVMVRNRAGSERTVVVQRTGRPNRAVVVERTRPGARLTGGAPKVRTFDLTRR